MKTYEFNENNSGGRWWLNKNQYEKLFEAGWKYIPSEYDIEHGYDKKALLGGDDNVPYGWRHGLTIEAESIRDAVESFEAATGENFWAEGCNCCGAPFGISSSDGQDYEYISGDSVERTPRLPW